MEAFEDLRTKGERGTYDLSVEQNWLTQQGSLSTQSTCQKLNQHSETILISNHKEKCHLGGCVSL